MRYRYHIFFILFLLCPYRAVYGLQECTDRVMFECFTPNVYRKVLKMGIVSAVVILLCAWKVIRQTTHHITTTEKVEIVINSFLCLHFLTLNDSEVSLLIQHTVCFPVTKLSQR